eukprot:COSAG06_NODE_66_length_26393_cov_6.455161_26_plen_41_part_00
MIVTDEWENASYSGLLSIIIIDLMLSTVCVSSFMFVRSMS